MVFLTTDCQTSVQNMNYMVVIFHYIDVGWVLNKKIEFKSDFRSQCETIGKNSEACLKEWGIKKVCLDKKICCTHISN
jgi:hypothetical protein